MTFSLAKVSFFFSILFKIFIINITHKRKKLWEIFFNFRNVDQRIDIITNARKEANIVSPHTRYFLELDFWLPDLHLAFEYQVKKGRAKRKGRRGKRGIRRGSRKKCFFMD